MVGFIDVNIYNDENDSLDSCIIVGVLNYLVKHILFQLHVGMIDDPYYRKHHLSIDFRTHENIKTQIQNSIRKSKPDTCNFVVGGVAVLSMPMQSEKSSYIISTDLIELDFFSDVLAAKVKAVDPQTLKLFGHKKPIFDLRRLDKKTVQLIRNELLERIYRSILRIYKYLGFDQTNLKNSYQSTKKKKWIFEEQIGSPVFSRGKLKRKAQFIRRWEGQFVYAIARITDSNNVFRDFIFDVMWQPRSIDNETGRLSWMNKKTLIYLPKYEHITKLAFNVDGEELQFPFISKPWIKPREKGGGNIHLGDWQESTKNTVNLNF